MNDINTRSLDFVVELVEYIFTYPDDDYMTMECLCRKLFKYGLIDKKDGKWVANTPETDCTADMRGEEVVTCDRNKCYENEINDVSCEECECYSDMRGEE